MVGNREFSFGALPVDNGWQVGDRADKQCVEAALISLLDSREINFETVQTAIDIYLEKAKELGWELR